MLVLWRECTRLAKAGGEQWWYLSTLWCSLTGVTHWCNANKQVNDSQNTRKRKKNVSTLQPLSEPDFHESWGHSLCDLCECRHVTWAVQQCAVICTKKTLYPFEAPGTRTGLSFNCRLQYQRWIQFTQQPTVLMPPCTFDSESNFTPTLLDF